MGTQTLASCILRFLPANAGSLAEGICSTVDENKFSCLQALFFLVGASIVFGSYEAVPALAGAGVAHLKLNPHLSTCSNGLSGRSLES